MPWLSSGGDSIELAEGETLVGGGAQAAWRVGAAGLAPRHFVVAVRRGAATVRPFGPDAIVTLNGRQIPAGEPSRLRDGDIIGAGSARFVYAATRLAGEAAGSRENGDAEAHLVNTATGTVHPLDRPSVGIGRDRSNSVVVTDPTASRFHAEVRREAGGWVLHPMGSSGTRVNGRRTGTPCLLEDGDEIEVAYTSLRFARGPAPGGTSAGGAAPPTDEELDAGRRPTIEVGEDTVVAAEAAVPRPAPGAGATGGASRIRWWHWVLVVVLLAILIIWSTAG